MKSLPKTYESGKLTALYHALQVPEETIEQIKQYFQAMVNFYRIIPLKKVYEIISEQNPDWISKETFFAVTDVIRHSRQDYVILKLDELFDDVDKSERILENGLLLHECMLVDMDACYDFIELAEGKPYFIPPKEILLQYADENYYEETPQTTALKEVFLDMGLSKKRSEEMLLECLIYIMDENSTLLEPLFELQRLQLRFNDRTIRSFVRRYRDLHNHYPLPANCGCKPVDLIEIFPDMPNEVLFWTEDVYQNILVKKQMQEMVDTAEQQPRKTMVDFMQQEIGRQELMKRLGLDKLK